MGIKKNKLQITNTKKMMMTNFERNFMNDDFFDLAPLRRYNSSIFDDFDRQMVRRPRINNFFNDPFFNEDPFFANTSRALDFFDEEPALNLNSSFFPMRLTKNKRRTKNLGNKTDFMKSLDLFNLENLAKDKVNS